MSLQEIETPVLLNPGEVGDERLLVQHHLVRVTLLHADEIVRSLSTL